MKFSVATVAFAAAVSAQTITQCDGKAQVCLDDATLAASDCALGDWACGCQPDNLAAIRTAATSCVVSACGGLIPALNVLVEVEAICADILG
ncbi:unnamed protein product [Parascedosporium putredinis]|uniref:CFEM domain-containing protein n=1 Tax=Parascedosporium putredinis TaxID=1442378 RepID=A0A9P1H178_9PEZI|nr:unnamed protein product [Parascedosporium putredinis]CAI7993493.1 unnamed protein product [Parascedosporium putredinis]